MDEIPLTNSTKKGRPANRRPKIPVLPLSERDWTSPEHDYITPTLESSLSRSSRPRPFQPGPSRPVSPQPGPSQTRGSSPTTSQRVVKVIRHSLEQSISFLIFYTFIKY